MTDPISLDPGSAIEAHSTITIHLDGAGDVVDARFHATPFRGFERIVRGRPLYEMPSIMARLGGICPVSHLIASAKACDDILGVEPPPAGVALRRVVNMAEIVQSNALSFFHLSSPELLFGAGTERAGGVVAANPQLARDGIEVRRFGQHIVEWLGGKRHAPAWVVPGGVDAPLTADVRDRALATVPAAIAAIERALAWYLSSLAGWADEAATFGEFSSAFLGLVDRAGNVDHYGGCLRVVAADGGRLAEGVDPRRYAEVLGEAIDARAHLTATYWKALGYQGGVYRVGPLARVVVADQTGTPRADAALDEFRRRLGRVPGSSFHYHYARLIDTLHATESIEALLRDPDILARDVRSAGDVAGHEGVGVSEAPRGTLVHHYRVDDDGIVQWANLVPATAHNNLAMSRGVLQVAQRCVKGPRLPASMLSRVEAVLRCFDPCLPSSTHALGEMALRVRLVDQAGSVLDELVR